jgi:hypothetical protein
MGKMKEIWIEMNTSDKIIETLIAKIVTEAKELGCDVNMKKEGF